MVALLLHGEACGHDLVVDVVAVGEDLREAPEGGCQLLPVHCLVDEDADGAAAHGLDSADHLPGLVIEDLCEEAVDGTGVGPALGLLVLEAVEFTEDFDGNEDVVVLEAVQAVRVMQEHIGVEDEVLGEGHRFFAATLAGGRGGDGKLILGGFHG